MNWEKYLKLNESTITYGYPESGNNAISGDDDFPTGNIIIGDKYKNIPYYNKLTSFNTNWIPDEDEWTWDEFDSTIAQASTKVYHDTLHKNGPVSDRMFKHMNNKNPKPVPKTSRLLGNDIGPFTDGWGNPIKTQKTADTDDVEGPEHSDEITSENIINKIDMILWEKNNERY